MTAVLDPRLSSLHLPWRGDTELLLAGRYRSVFKGSGLEFEEARPYTSDDDARQIDWLVTARTGSPHVRRFREERELNVLFALDLSASSTCPGAAGSRRQLLATCCTHLAGAALRNHDRCGLVLFTDRIEGYLPPTAGQAAALRLIDAAHDTVPQGTRTSLATALGFISDLRLRRSLVFVLSDFADDGYADALAVLAARHEVIAVSVRDPHADAPPPVGLCQLVDPETGTVVLADLGATAPRQAADAAARAQRQRLETLLADTPIDEIALTIGNDVVADLLAFFGHRQGRIAGEAGG